MYVWIDSKGLIVFTFDKDSAPKNAIFIDQSLYNPMPPLKALVSVSNGQIKLNSHSEVLEKWKQLELSKLSQTTTDYILKHYPDWKQCSDLIDLANGEIYLISEGVDFQKVKQTISKELLSGAPYTQALSVINKTFNDKDNPTIKYWLEQVLKALYRQNFVFKVKQQYYSIQQQLISTTTLPIPSYSIDVAPPDIGA